MPSLETKFSHSWVDQKDLGPAVGGDLKASVSCFLYTERHFISATISNLHEMPDGEWYLLLFEVQVLFKRECEYFFDHKR